MYKNCKRYKEDYLYERLKDRDNAYRHIIAAFDEADKLIILQCIKNVIQARAKALEKKGNPQG